MLPDVPVGPLRERTCGRWVGRDRGPPFGAKPLKYQTLSTMCERIFSHARMMLTSWKQQSSPS